MYSLLKMAAVLVLTVSTLHIYFDANLYSPYHKVSDQNIPCSILVISYSFLIIVKYKMLELHVLFSIHSSDIPQWRVSYWFITLVALCFWGRVTHQPLL